MKNPQALQIILPSFGLTAVLSLYSFAPGEIWGLRAGACFLLFCLGAKFYHELTRKS